MRASPSAARPRSATSPRGWSLVLGQRGGWSPLPPARPGSWSGS